MENSYSFMQLSDYVSILSRDERALFSIILGDLLRGETFYTLEEALNQAYKMVLVTRGRD
jgi:hypothetical protein